MSKYSAFAVFCDDIRHEVGGGVSLMGVYGNVAERLDSSPLRMSCLVVIRCLTGEDIGALSVQLSVTIDEAEHPDVHTYPPLPSGPTVPDPLTQKLIDIYGGNVPGGAPMSALVGLISAEAIPFERSCVFSASVEGEEIGRVVIFRSDVGSSQEHSSQKSTRAVAPKKATARKSTTRTKVT